MRNYLNKLFISSLIAFSIFNTASVKAEEPVEFSFDSIKFPPLHDVAIPDVNKVTLNNGMRIYLLEN